MDSMVSAVFPAGAIVSCPGCGLGLYKVTANSTIQDLILDNGTLLVPLNSTIPLRTVWSALACPFCGARLFKDGRIHTLQHGWV